jgi:hypothetical protein
MHKTCFSSSRCLAIMQFVHVKRSGMWNLVGDASDHRWLIKSYFRLSESVILEFAKKIEELVDFSTQFKHIKANFLERST